eukprot:1175184-Rhodomonas_salina.2
MALDRLKRRPLESTGKKPHARSQVALKRCALMASRGRMRCPPLFDALPHSYALPLCPPHFLSALPVVHFLGCCARRTFLSLALGRCARPESIPAPHPHIHS